MLRIHPSSDESQQNDQQQKVDIQQINKQDNQLNHHLQNIPVKDQIQTFFQVVNNEQPQHPFSPTYIIAQENVMKQDKSQPNPQLQNQNSAQSSNFLTCKICLLSSQDEESIQLGQFISICDCKGSIQYVHFNCQKDFLEKQYGKTKQHLITDCLQQQKQKKKKKRYQGVKQHKCDLCSQEYQVEWTSNLVKRPFLNIKSKKSRLFLIFIVTLITFLLLLFTILYLSIVEYNSADDVFDTIFSFLGLMISSFAFFCSFIILSVIIYKLFFVRIYFIKSIQKTEQKNLIQT